MMPELVRTVDKSPDAFRTISEVADHLDLPQHVLRFWESRFAQIKPLKRGGGRRYYRPEDVDLLKGIRHLLYGEGYTIKGVQRILKEDGIRFVQSIGRGDQAAPPPGPSEAAGAQEEEPAPVPVRMDGSPDLLAPLRPGLSPEDVARLRGALAELRECERLLAALRQDEAEGG
jgi:DNA-binding transcriptional MerR regulator